MRAGIWKPIWSYKIVIVYPGGLLIKIAAA